MVAGIYEILNTVNGKRYIGSTNNFERRFTRHRTDLNSGGHHCIKLQRAWIKYGPKAFKFSRLLICSQENLELYEQLSMDALHPEYNVAPVAGSCTGITRSAATKEKLGAVNRGKKRTAEQCERNAAARRGKKLTAEHCKNMGDSRRGIPLTQEHKDAIARGKTGVKTGPQSPEQVAKRALAATGKKHSPEWCAKIGSANAIALLGKPWSPARRAAQERRKSK